MLLAACSKLPQGGHHNYLLEDHVPSLRFADSAVRQSLHLPYLVTSRVSQPARSAAAQVSARYIGGGGINLRIVSDERSSGMRMSDSEVAGFVAAGPGGCAKVASTKGKNDGLGIVQGRTVIRDCVSVSGAGGAIGSDGATAIRMAGESAERLLFMRTSAALDGGAIHTPKEFKSTEVYPATQVKHVEIVASASGCPVLSGVPDSR